MEGFVKAISRALKTRSLPFSSLLMRSTLRSCLQPPPPLEKLNGRAFLNVLWNLIVGMRRSDTRCVLCSVRLDREVSKRVRDRDHPSKRMSLLIETRDHKSTPCWSSQHEKCSTGMCSRHLSGVKHKVPGHVTCSYVVLIARNSICHAIVGRPPCLAAQLVMSAFSQEA